MTTKLVRVNTNISEEINEWLAARSEKTGISKSTLIHLALEQYKNQHDVMTQLPNIALMMQQLNGLNIGGSLSLESADKQS